VAAWRKELETNNEWYRSRQIWLILYERGEILVWRNLFRRAWKYLLLLDLSAPLESKLHCLLKHPSRAVTPFPFVRVGEERISPATWRRGGKSWRRTTSGIDRVRSG
jgi:hypothetical protein